MKTCVSGSEFNAISARVDRRETERSASAHGTRRIKVENLNTTHLATVSSTDAAHSRRGVVAGVATHRTFRRVTQCFLPAWPIGWWRSKSEGFASSRPRKVSYNSSLLSSVPAANAASTAPVAAGIAARSWRAVGSNRCRRCLAKHLGDVPRIEGDDLPVQGLRRLVGCLGFLSLLLCVEPGVLQEDEQPFPCLTGHVGGARRAGQAQQRIVDLGFRRTLCRARAAGEEIDKHATSFARLSLPSTSARNDFAAPPSGEQGRVITLRP